MGFVLTGEQILVFCGFVTAVYGVYKIFKELTKPAMNLKDEVERHKEYLTKDLARINDIEESNKLIMKSLLMIINHNITGNGIDKMKEIRNELQEYLIDK